MGLAAYNKKRSPKETPEPFGGKADSNQLRFVIQKHAASHLHYDFRLEMEGVLKSWAVPKGPSTDPSIKRLAMMVEDHPYDYRDFEGIIPAGQYGGGTVIVWDEGTYEPAETESKDKKQQDKELRHQLHKGKIRFILKGKKLKGEYALVKAYGRGDNGWLLMKIDDEHASTNDITKKDKSVISKKTIEQVAKTSTNIYGQSKKDEKKEAVEKKSAKKNSTAKTIKKGDTEIPAKTKTKPGSKGRPPSQLLKKAVATKFPDTIKPMLATLVDKPFDDKGWSYEIKWDGYRALALMNKGFVELKSRNDKSFKEKFYPVFDAIKRWKINAVIDGEIVVLNEKGAANFDDLQRH